MKPSTLLASAIFVLAIAAPIAAFVEDTTMPQSKTSTGLRVPFLHGSLDGLLSRSTLPSVERATEWINSPPLTASALRGKVVLVDFWTYTCINWLRTLPYVRGWAAKALRVNYPIAVDSDYVIWRGFENQYWPALYFVDAQGRTRHHHFGEGAYEQSEMTIQELLAQNGAEGISREP